MIHNTEYKGKGLLPLTPDDDYSHARVFGTLPQSELPTQDFFVSEPLEIKNQDINYDSDFCASYGGCEVAEDQELVTLVPEYSFAKAKQLIAEKRGIDVSEAIQEFGLNLRDICLTAVKVGFLERQFDPFACDTVDRPARDFVANYANWSADLDMLAAEHRKNSFFTCDGPYDRFDNFRMTMWKNLSESRSIFTGVYWRPSWTTADKGIIPATINTDEMRLPHALKIFGQITIAGVMYLAAQLSDGPLIGDAGVFYFPREIVNSEFSFGEFTFKDMPALQAKYHHDNGISVDTPIWLRIVKVLWTSLLKLIGKK